MTHIVNDPDARASSLERCNLINWQTAFETAPTDVEWLVPGILPRSKSAALVGPGGEGKSLLALDMAAALAAGKPVLGHAAHPDKINVLYLDMENNQNDLVSTLRDMGYAPSDLAGRLHYCSFPNLGELDAAQGGRFLHWLANDVDADLIVLDTICRFVEGDENSNDTWQNLYRHSLAPLKADGRAVLRLDHTGRDTSKGSRGATAKNDDPDVIWLLSAGKLDDAGGRNVTLKQAKQRQPYYPQTVDIRREVGPLRHLVVDAPEAESDKVADCVAALNELNVPSVTGRDKATTALKAGGYKFRTATIAAAVKARKEPVPA